MNTDFYMLLSIHFFMDSRMKDLGNALKRRRESLGMTQEDVAAIADLERSYLSDIENGKRPLKVVILLRIVDAMKIKLCDVVGDAEI